MMLQMRSSIVCRPGVWNTDLSWEAIGMLKTCRIMSSTENAIVIFVTGINIMICLVHMNTGITIID